MTAVSLTPKLLTPYKPKRNPWNACELLHRIEHEQLRLSPQKIAHFRDFFWNDLCAEWDSSNLYNEIIRRHQCRPFTQEFMAFHEAWYLDEQNHADGFFTLLELLCGEKRASLLTRLKCRKTNFTFLEEFFEDEFTLCVLFAYDEYATLQTFSKDTFYKEFGSPLFVEWIRRVRTDESLHFTNLVRLIHCVYPHRLAATRAVMHRILEVEKTLDGYHATFLFDHEDSHFLLTEEELTGECATTVLRRILREPRAVL